MTKKQSVLLALAVLLLCVYVYYFTDWFASESIQIVHTLRPYTPSRRGRARNSDDNPLANTVSFGFNRKCRLTEVKVIPVSDLAPRFRVKLRADEGSRLRHEHTGHASQSSRGSPGPVATRSRLPALR